MKKTVGFRQQERPANQKTGHVASVERIDSPPQQVPRIQENGQQHDDLTPFPPPTEQTYNRQEK